MTLKKSDLHMHSNFSDGELAPFELFSLAKSRGVQLLSLTDHDTMGGQAVGKNCADKLSVEFLSGIELTTQDSFDAHILGYGFSIDNPRLLEFCQKMKILRQERAKKILSKLKKYYSISIDFESLEANEEGSVCRLQIARQLVRQKIVKNIAQAFNLYVGDNCKSYEKLDDLAAVQAIELLNSCGAMAVLAHPSTLKCPKDTKKSFVASLCEIGLKGIESRYFAHTSEQIEEYSLLARQLSLTETGGSDFHGLFRDDLLGKVDFLWSSAKCQKYV